MTINLRCPAKTFIALDLDWVEGTPVLIDDGMPVYMWGEHVGKVDSHLVGRNNIIVSIAPTFEDGACQQLINHTGDIKSIEVKDGYIDIIM